MVLAAGPGLSHGVEEVDVLALDHPLADRYTGERATVAAVTAALDGADVAHIAAHGHLRTDNPLFSALQLADGPLTVYDLERLATPPRLMVLSACDTGLADIRPGDEQLGLASALLGMGTSSLVAAVLPVDDAVTSALMSVPPVPARRAGAGGCAGWGQNRAPAGRGPASRGLPLLRRGVMFYNNGAQCVVVVE